MKKGLQYVLATLMMLGWGGGGLAAAPFLDGVSFFSGSNFWGYPDVQVWVESNGNWVTTQSGYINFELLEGDNHFNFYASGNGLELNTIGMNFQLGGPGEPCQEGISITGSSGSSSFAANGAGSYWPASVRCGGISVKPGSNQTVWTNGVDTVELTQFTYLDHQSSGVNRVSYVGPNPEGSPDTWPDHFGSFTLRLNDPAGGPDPSAIPEPSMVLAVGIGLAAFGWRRRSYK